MISHTNIKRKYIQVLVFNILCLYIIDKYSKKIIETQNMFALFLNFFRIGQIMI